MIRFSSQPALIYGKGGSISSSYATHKYQEDLVPEADPQENFDHPPSEKNQTPEKGPTVNRRRTSATTDRQKS